MNHLNLRGRYFLLLIILVAGCTFPFTTASYKWNIKYDKKKLAFKENFLKQELPPYSGNKLPNILFIVIDDVGKSEISRPSRWRSIRITAASIGRSETSAFPTTGYMMVSILYLT